MKFPTRKPIKPIKRDGLPLVLMVEDDPGVTRLVEYKMSKYACRFLHQDNGLDGLVAIQRLQPDLVILDLHLPKMNGDEVLRRIREDDNIKNTKVLVLTATTKEHEVRNLLKLRVDAYVAKPFSVRDFMDRVEGLLHAKRVE